MKPWLLAVLLSLSLTPALAQSSGAAGADEHTVIVRRLASGQTVVVAEGDLEARSIGSYSVRLYQAAALPDRTTYYQDGVVVARDGTVERVQLAQVDGQSREDIVVVVRSVGSGGYLSARAFAYDQNNLALIAQVDNLPPDADPLAALRLSMKKPPAQNGTGGMGAPR